MTILYKVYNNLYVNLTNRCPCACTFCLRQTRDHMDDSGTLWLKKEPTVEEVIDELKNTISLNIKKSYSAVLASQPKHLMYCFR